MENARIRSCPTRSASGTGYWQTPETHDCVDAHVVPQAPQLARSEPLINVSQPSLWRLLLQSPQPLLQVPAHLPVVVLHGSDPEAGTTFCREQ